MDSFLQILKTTLWIHNIKMNSSPQNPPSLPIKRRHSSPTTHPNLILFIPHFHEWEIYILKYIYHFLKNFFWTFIIKRWFLLQRYSHLLDERIWFVFHYHFYSFLFNVFHPSHLFRLIRNLTRIKKNVKKYD